MVVGNGSGGGGELVLFLTFYFSPAFALKEMFTYSFVTMETKLEIKHIHSVLCQIYSTISFLNTTAQVLTTPILRSVRIRHAVTFAVNTAPPVGVSAVHCSYAR